MDGIRGGNETDTDCGGAACLPCGDGEECLLSTDCLSDICDAELLVCLPTNCADGELSGNETDVDCGGPTCDGCTDGEGCSFGTDCARPPPPAPVSAVSSAHNTIPTCCTSMICQCEGVAAGCEVDTSFPFEWVDLIDSGAGTRINNGDWTQNDDDGWFEVTLPFDFHWFGQVERTITIGTNGVLTFGAGQLPYGSSEPVPCVYGNDGCSNGVQVDGVIAPLWCDLNPAVSGADDGEGVYYQVIDGGNPLLESFNKLIVEYQVPTFGTETMIHIEVILFGDGGVLFQYADMPADSGSWSHESIGFEDHSGAMGVQILYGSMPASNTAYMIPAACHLSDADLNQQVLYDGCCTSQPCQCENVNSCTVATDYDFAWVDLIDSGVGTRIDNGMWTQNDECPTTAFETEQSKIIAKYQALGEWAQPVHTRLAGKLHCQSGGRSASKHHTPCCHARVLDILAPRSSRGSP